MLSALEKLGDLLADAKFEHAAPYLDTMVSSSDSWKQVKVPSRQGSGKGHTNKTQQDVIGNGHAPEQAEKMDSDTQITPR